MKKLALVVLTVGVLSTAACSGMSTQQQRTLSGGAIGAAGGAIIGLAAGSPAIGAVVGGAVGATAGALIK